MPAMADPAHVPTCLISLRPSGQHEALRRAAARVGMRLLAVSPWRLQARDDPETRLALAAALAAPVVVFSSPMAVRAAAALASLGDGAGARQWLAVGEGTARALRRAGVSSVQAPSRMDSEGLLALPALIAAEHVGLVTAPGGRGMLAAALAQRGVPVARADVYQRVPQRLPASVLARLRALEQPSVLALSSAEALQQVLRQLPADLLEKWRRQPVVVASTRLGQMAREHGFAHVIQAAGPRPAQLLSALARRGGD